MSQYLDIETSLKNLSPCKFIDTESESLLNHTITLSYTDKKFTITNLFETELNEYKIVKYKKITDKKIIVHFSRIIKVNLEKSLLIQITVSYRTTLFPKKLKFLLEICKNEMDNQGIFLLNIFSLVNIGVYGKNLTYLKTLESEF